MRIKTEEFLKELKAIDPRIEVIQNPNYPKLMNVKILGQDVCPLPADEISETADQSHRMDFNNGMSVRHKSREEVISQVHATLRFIENPENLKEFTEA
jgi:hypothetical protein